MQNELYYENHENVNAVIMLSARLVLYLSSLIPRSFPVLHIV
jgi:hypothetical protein